MPSGLLWNEPPGVVDGNPRQVTVEVTCPHCGWDYRLAAEESYGMVAITDARELFDGTMKCDVCGKTFDIYQEEG